MAAIRLALSDERLAAYATPVDEDELDSVARYLWNVALACAMGPGLHALEVTLRNNLFNASRRVVDETRLRFAEVPCWLDANPSLLYEREEEAVAGAKGTLWRAKKQLTPGRLVAALPFGFWVGLFRSPYEHGRQRGPALWPAALEQAFPFLPKDHRTRHAVHVRLDEIRELRNRAFHHEPLWNRDLSRSHRRIVEVIAWMNQGIATAVRELSTVEELVADGFPRYRRLAESLIKR